MLMKNDKKNNVTLIMNKLMGKKPEMEQAPMKDGAEQDDSVALDTAAEEMMSALEQKNTKAFVEAFKSMMDLCDQDEPSEPQE